MKKLMIVAAMMAFTATSALAQDVLKQIAAAKTVADAKTILNSNLSSLSNEDKAKAYNEVVKMALKKVNDEQQVLATNQVTGKNNPVDTQGMLDASVDALKLALECDKYDQLPNAKGKIKPRFRKALQQEVYNVRTNVLNAGVEYTNAQDNVKAEECFALYLNTAKAPLFEGVAAASDPNMGVASYYAGRSAIINENFDKAIGYLDYALADTSKQISEQAFDFKLYAMSKSQKTKEDSLKFVNDLKELLVKYPDNTRVFGTLGDAYLQQNRLAELTQLCDSRLAANPNDELAYIYKGVMAMNDKKHEDAIDAFNHVSPSYANYLQVVYNRGCCKWNLASDLYEKTADMRTGRMSAENEAKFKDMLNSAREDFEKAKELDPDQQSVKWLVLLKNTYHNLGMTEQEKELELY